jgi:aldose 1-epimerase
LGDVVLGYDTVAEYVVRSIDQSSPRITAFCLKLALLSSRDKLGYMDGCTTTVLCETETVNNVQNGSAYFGGLIGRVANRIAGARFVLDGKAYRLYRNDGNNSLHGEPQLAV